MKRLIGYKPVRFLKSWGSFSAGQTIQFPIGKANILIDEGVVVEVKSMSGPPMHKMIQSAPKEKGRLKTLSDRF